MTVRIEPGDMREVLPRLAAEGVRVHAVVTDPPYHLTSIVKRFGAPEAQPAKGNDAYVRASRGFMGKLWDGGDIAFQPETWRLAFDLLPPGGHLIAFGGTRTYHRMACAIEDAGFELRDMIAWLYGSGFPKSHNVSKAIDRAAGAEREVIGRARTCKGDSGPQTYAALGEFRQSRFVDVTAPATAEARAWDGWGTALKPALEPICLARKPVSGTVAANVLAHAVGALNVEGCRIEAHDKTAAPVGQFVGSTIGPSGHNGERNGDSDHLGRWPANVVHDGSDEVRRAFPETTPSTAGVRNNNNQGHEGWSGGTFRSGPLYSGHADTGSAARFFYSAKADDDDRLGSKHPTIKPVDLMRWLVRMVTPPRGIVLDPFAGSGTTAMACMAEGLDCIVVERDPESLADIQRRIAHVRGDDTPLFARSP